MLHWCQLNVKVILEPAFRLSRSPAPTGNAVLETPPLLLAAEPQLKCISSPEAGNEVLKGFGLKLIPMNMLCLYDYLYLIMQFVVVKKRSRTLTKNPPK
ncbi:hypothetical protein CDG76_20145 [Nostoc sp. 'Peltigera membranacea cyanobiont' 210A]|uniref:hypothetical protein n=1 Tax=Nostoc sp. 'Peltigera membranacea cyanobiont' 210A TaxID=2014529 RepID=UPI000B952EC1|nr:hypothetical protein [Nostoc sp. 'Peltigera membranacea cyanobiont' 210A]OYD93016.1 hypothetical protein CDG76_20145 [Nostoc sp. 'Peltigera membranacea cyanobiont' 210A]